VAQAQEDYRNVSLLPTMAALPSGGCALFFVALQVPMSVALLLKTTPEQEAAPYWPVKNGNLNHTGLSPFRAPFHLEQPSWIFEPKRTRHPESKANGHSVGMMKVFHSSPIIDSNRNSYIVETTGMLYSVDPRGKLRWQFELSGTNPGNPGLLDGVLYAQADDGIAYAIDAATGHELWHARIAPFVTSDTYSVVVEGNTAIMQGNFVGDREIYAKPGTPYCGSSQLVAVSTTDGSVKWRYDITKRSGALALNADPAIVDGSVVVADTAGGVYRVSLEDGAEIWYTPGTAGTSTTGGLAVGPNDMVYVVGQYVQSGDFNGLGVVRALHLGSGSEEWNRKFQKSANVAPAVGPVGPNGELAVVVPIGWNMPPAPISPEMKASLNSLRASDGSELAITSVHALDATSGEDLWSLEIPARNYTASTKGSFTFPCAPDVFGTPAIDADGVVFVNWSGGRAFALYDANKDGRIDAANPLELSSYEHGYGTNGESAIAPGMLVAPCCNSLIGFVQ